MHEVRARLIHDLTEAAGRLREMNVAPARAGLAERIVNITVALERFDAGIYGICGRCGQSIPTARLDVMPEAELCRNCEDVTAQPDLVARSATR